MFSSEETISIRELLSVSIFLAEKGGQELVRIYDSGSLNTAEKTGKSDLVTKGEHCHAKTWPRLFYLIGDHASHDIMYFGMKKAFSSINIVSEEESEEETAVNFQIEYRVGSFSRSRLDVLIRLTL